MNLNYLRTFLTAAKYENFHQTSEKLYLSQPTVTFHIKQLERELGSPLFVRDKKRIYLSRAGHVMVDEAEKILNAYESAVTSVSNLQKGYRTNLTLAVSPIVAATHFPYIVQKYMAAHPEVNMNIRVLDSEEVLAAVDENTCDLGFSRMAPKHRHTVFEKINEDPIVFAVPAEPGSDETAPVDAETALGRWPLITHNHPGYWDDLVQSILSRYHPHLMTISQISVTKRFIEQGLGCSFIPLIAVRREVAEGRIQLAEAKNFTLPLCHTYLINNKESEEISRFKVFMGRLMQ